MLIQEVSNLAKVINRTSGQIPIAPPQASILFMPFSGRSDKLDIAFRP
jgi:hypothetical protein